MGSTEKDTAIIMTAAMSSVRHQANNEVVRISRRRGQAFMSLSKLGGGHSPKTKMAAYLICLLVVYVMGTTIYQSHFAGMFVPDIEVDETGRKRVRRRPQLHRQKLDPSKPTTEMDAILEGYLTMIDLNVPPTALQGVESYHGVSAKFCHIDWKLQQKAPHKVPMFNDLIRQSKMCDSTMVTVDLWDIVKQSKAYDAKLNAEISVVPPTGMVFHESRCGSTLMANLLAGFSPDDTRVYSENTVQLTSLLACEGKPCNPDLHTQLIQDVFYMSGRSVHTEKFQYVFYKISSMGTLYINAFTSAFPQVPWLYLYRDTVEVMQSHLDSTTSKNKGGGGGGFIKSRERPVCLRLQTAANAQHQPSTTIQIAQSKHRDPMTLSKEEYCATHLAALSLSAIQEYQRTKKGRFVNYNTLPDFVWDTLLPQDYGITVDAAMMERMKELSQKYSKARNRQDASFSEDGTIKRQHASPQVMTAADTFARDIYEQLETLAQQQRLHQGVP